MVNSKYYFLRDEKLLMFSTLALSTEFGYSSFGVFVNEPGMNKRNCEGRTALFIRSRIGVNECVSFYSVKLLSAVYAHVFR